MKYKDLRENVGLIVQDARTYGEVVIEKGLAAIHPKPQQVFRTEKRVKTPGRILKMLRRREWLGAHWRQLPSDAVERS